MGKIIRSKYLLINQVKERANPVVFTEHLNQRESHLQDIVILILQKDKVILKVSSEQYSMIQEEELHF